MAHLVIIGGGIAGLAAALAFARRGASVEILEQAPAITEVGAGLQISPNGMRVMEALGLGDALTHHARRAEAVILRDYRRPGEVFRLDLTRRPDRPYHFIHRADLIDLLFAAVRHAGLTLTLNAPVSGVRPGPRPEVLMSDGGVRTGDLVIGADGLHSRARAALNGEYAPFFTGQVAWRAVVPMNETWADAAQVTMAPGRHMVMYPLRNGRFVNLVAVQERRDWAAEGWHHADDPANLRAAFADVRGPARTVLDRVDTVALWGLFRHPVAGRWVAQNVALVGDAAHPTLPFLAQGANLALEDAWALAASFPDDLAGYQTHRKPRATRVIAASNRNAWKYHVRFGPARLIGHTALRLGASLAPDRMLGQFEWLYGYDVTAQFP